MPQSPPALAGKINPLYAHHPRTLFDTVVTHKWNDRLTQASEAFFIIDTDVVQTNGNVLREASWYGYANWFLYTFDSDEKYTGVWRSEIFKDTKGTATGVADDLLRDDPGPGLQAETLALVPSRSPVRLGAVHQALQRRHPRAASSPLAIDVIVQF